MSDESDAAQVQLDALKTLCPEGETDEAHEAHRSALEAAYSTFAAATGNVGSTPAAAETPLTADVQVISEAQ